jgi:hypothetical protein
MADVLTGVTETSAAALANVSKVAQAYLVQKSVLLPTVTDYSYLAVQGAGSILVPKLGGFTPANKGENTAVERQTAAATVDTISFLHRQVAFGIEKKASKETMVDIVNEYVMRATADLALDVDKFIIAELEKASSSAPDHQIVFIDTSTDVIAKGDVLAARKLLIDQNLNPRECYIVIGSEKEKELLGLADFVQAERYGSNMPIMNGEIGMVYGMKVIVHTAVSDYMLAYHPSAVGYAFSQPIQLDFQKNVLNIGTDYVLDYLAGFEVLDSGKRCVKVDSTN